MLNPDFYKLINTKLEELLEKYKDDEYLERQKNPDNQKSYAFLIWFLEFYRRTSNYQPYITDGINDGSCDLIFDYYNQQNARVFYVVQSKWNTLNNCNKKIKRGEVLQALQDFETILRGGKKNVNDKLQQRLEEFQEHIKKNGEVRFIFLSLCNYNEEVQDNVESFEATHKRTKIEFIDIHRLKDI